MFQNLSEKLNTAGLKINISRRIFLLLLAVLFIFLSLLSFFLISNKKPQPSSVKKITSISENAEFVPDEIIVKYMDGYVPEDLRKKISEENILSKIKYTFNPTSDPETKLKTLEELFEKIGVISQEKLHDTNDPILRRFYILKLRRGTDVRLAHKILNSAEGIESVEPNYIMVPFATPNDPYYQNSPGMWGLEKIQMPKAWDIAKGSKSIIVAVIDTGTADHDDLPPDIIRANPGVGSHGTHVAGTIGALTNNSKGVSGVNWEVTIMSIQAIGGGMNSTAAIRYAADNGAKVINMSFGNVNGTVVNCENSPAYMHAISYAIDRGVVLVASAGNENMDSSRKTPASCPGVLTVGATGPNDERSYYSSYGSVVEISAPGGDKRISGGVCTISSCIVSTVPGGGYSYNYQGTSMASPHLAGAAALLLSVNPSLTPQQVSDCLVNNADSIAQEPGKPIGPRLNAFEALRACSSGAPPPVLTPNPTVTSQPIQYGISGSVFTDTNGNRQKDIGEGGVQGVTLTLVGPPNTETDTDTNGDYSFPSLAEGTYTITATFAGQSNSGSVILTSSFPQAKLDFGLISGGGPIPIHQPTGTPAITPGTGGGGAKAIVTPTTTPVKTYTCREDTKASTARPGSIEIRGLFWGTY